MSPASITPLERMLPFFDLAMTLVAGGVALMRYYELPPNLRALAWLLAFVVPMNVLGTGLALQHHSNLFLMPLYAVGELALLCVVYGRTLRAAWFTRLAVVLVVGFAVYVVVDSFPIPATEWLRPGQQVVAAVLELVLVALYFRQLLHELRITQLRREPMFWVSAGLLVYAAGYLQIALFSNYLLHYSHTLNLHVWSINAVLFAVLYGCYAWALWLSPRK